MLLPLLVLVASLPEPSSSSSAFTNATSQRSFDVATPRKPPRRVRAKRAWEKIEPEREAYLKLELRLDQRSLREMSRAAESLEKKYLAIVEIGDARSSVAAWSGIAEIYLHFAEQIRRAPGDELDAMARGPERRAREAIERGLELARRTNVWGASRAKLESQAASLLP